MAEKSFYITGVSTMTKFASILIAMCVGAAITTPSIAAEPEPTIECKGKAISPVAGAELGNGEVSLSATFRYGRTLEIVLIDNRSNQLEPPFDYGVEVHTGSLTVERARSKETLKMLWQRAGASTDFIGFAITGGYTTVLHVDSFDYGNAPKGAQLQFSFFDGFDTALYRGICTAH
jgi:hypothetical protein